MALSMQERGRGRCGWRWGQRGCEMSENASAGLLDFLRPRPGVRRPDSGRLPQAYGGRPCRPVEAFLGGVFTELSGVCEGRLKPKQLTEAGAIQLGHSGLQDRYVGACTNCGARSVGGMKPGVGGFLRGLATVLGLPGGGEKWDRQDSNLQPRDYAPHFGFRRLFRVCGPDHPFRRLDTVCLPSGLYTCCAGCVGLWAGTVWFGIGVPGGSLV